MSFPTIIYYNKYGVVSEFGNPQTKLQFMTGLQVDDNFFEFATRDSHEKALELSGWAPAAGGWPNRDWLMISL